MGLFRALIVVAVSVFVLSIINDDTKLKAIPLIGSRIDKSVKICLIKLKYKKWVEHKGYQTY